MKLSLIKPIETDLPVIVSLFEDGGQIYIIAGKEIIAFISSDGYLKRVKLKHSTQMISLGFKVESGYVVSKDTEIAFSTQR